MRRVVILAFAGLQTLDLHGPAEVLSTATSLNRGDGDAVEVVAPEPGPVRTSSVALHPDGTIAAALAARRSSAHSWPPRSPSARRSGSSRRGSPTTSPPTCPCRRWRGAPA